MTRNSDLFLTALAPLIWGSSYLITTEFLPDGYPLTVAMLRALPAGLLLLLISRQLPSGIWIAKSFVLGALNFSIFWWLMFVAAYSLPGGVAAIVGAIQPLVVIFLSAALLGSSVRIVAVIAAIIGISGVTLLILNPEAALNSTGIIAGLIGAASMAAGTVLTRKWQPPVSLLTFVSWQLTAGGLLLVPAAMLFEPPLPDLNSSNIFGFVYLGLIGAAFTYILWFRGISRLEPSVVSTLGFLSPISAVILGWWFLDQTLSSLQIAGVFLVLGSIWLSQRPQLLEARHSGPGHFIKKAIRMAWR